MPFSFVTKLSLYLPGSSFSALSYTKLTVFLGASFLNSMYLSHDLTEYGFRRISSSYGKSLSSCNTIYIVAGYFYRKTNLQLYNQIGHGAELENWHSQRGPRWEHVTMTLTFDLLTPKSIGIFLCLSSICVWSMNSLGQTLFELSRYNEVWTDGRTDRRTDRQGDYYRARASSMAGP